MISHRASLDVDGRPLTKQPPAYKPRFSPAVMASVLRLTGLIKTPEALLGNTIKTYFPDFSHWSGEINWDIAALYLLASIFKASEGLDFVDSQYARNRAESIRLGLPWAAYHFYRVVDPIRQAAHFVNMVGAGCNQYILDIELAFYHDSAKVLACLQEIERLTGKRPAWYSSKYFAGFLRPFPTGWIGDYDFWGAHWQTLYPRYPTGAKLIAHQYETRGIIPGVQEAADENFYLGSVAEMLGWFGNGGAAVRQFLPIVARGG